MKRIAALFIVVILAICVVFISGCGGGGGSKNLALSGTVTDVAGNLVPGAEIKLDGRSVTTSLMNGTYKISEITAGAHNVEAVAKIDGDEWVGTRSVDVYNDGPTMNMNIVMGQYDDLGDLDGVVTDASNHSVPYARVYAVARYPQDINFDESSAVSKVAVANNRGEYIIQNLPSTLVVNGTSVDIIYDVVASSAGASGQPRGFENNTHTARIAGGMVTHLNFTLQTSDALVPTVPAGWTSEGAIYVISYTVPTSITTRASASAYDAIKSCISEKSRKVVALNRSNPKRSAPAGSLIENNVIWYSTWNSGLTSIPDNLAGFSIYRSTIQNFSQDGRYRIDFVRDPSISAYSDTSSTLTPGTSYSYGVSAVSTSYLNSDDEFNPDAESDMSYPATVTPLGKLSGVMPANNATMSLGNLTFSWQPLTSAESYRVYIYDSYPVVDSMFTPQGDPLRPDHLPSWGQSAVVTGSSVRFSDPDFQIQAGHKYWWVVMAADNDDFDYADAYSISDLRSFIAH